MKAPSILLVSSAALLVASCSKMKKFAADDFTVTPTPLEYAAGEVPATISANIPAKFMNKNAVVRCTPVLRWQGGEAAGASAVFQGEKVEANNPIISYKNGGHATLRTSFPFQDGMESSELFMTFDARKGNKAVRLPDVKIGYGTVCTAALVGRTSRTARGGVGQDNFQRVISQKQAATIKFLIAQSNLRGSELNSQNVKDFIQTLRNIKSDEQSLVLNNVEVSAYASPDGAYSFNEQLAERRGQVGEKYVNQQLRQTKLSAHVDMKYTAEDWDGFQELVRQSSLQDKDLILRVLSMYEDPEQREREIRNVAAVYKELADAVLPELRRARMTINYDVIGRNDDQIMEAMDATPNVLSVEEMLYAANMLATTDARREDIYNKIVAAYPSDYRAYNNLAEQAMRQGDTEKAQSYLRTALAKNAAAPEVNANLGLLALQEGNVRDAEMYMAKGSGSNNIDEALGNLYIAQGKYTQAAAKLEKTATNSGVLAQILAQDYAAAKQSLKNMQRPDATTHYLRALLGARMGDADAVREGLSAVAQSDSTLAARAKNDLEFQKYKDVVAQVLK